MIKIDYNKIYHTNNYGDYVIIKDIGKINNKRYLRIKFLYSNYEMNIRADRLGIGDFRDPYYPRIYGVACSGILDNRANYKTHYDRWINMISRCYNSNDKDYYNYGGIGVKVDTPWLCFETYYNDIKTLPGYNEYLKEPLNYQLDKDILQSHINKCDRIYSKDTCIWVNRRSNTIQRSNDIINKVNKYHGVYYNHGYYYFTIIVNGYKINIGKFDNEIAAANAYNYYITNGSYINAPNIVEYMAPEEFVLHNLKMKNMVKIVN